MSNTNIATPQCKNSLLDKSDCLCVLSNHAFIHKISIHSDDLRYG